MHLWGSLSLKSELYTLYVGSESLSTLYDIVGSIAMPDGNFCDQLPVIDDFADITDPNRYRPVPDDWLVVGAATITSVLNAVKPQSVPFVFGDVESHRPVCLDVMRLARSNQTLSSEVRVRTCGRTRLYRLAYWLWLRVQMAVGYFVFRDT